MHVTFVFGDDEHPFDVPAVPAVGHEVYVSFNRQLCEEIQKPGTFTDDALQKFRRLDCTWWVVSRVTHELRAGGTCVVTAHCAEVHK